MTKDEALDMALEFVEANHSGGPDAFELIAAIKQARSAPVQEPVAWEQYAIKFANGKKLTYEKPENLPSYIGVRALIYADTTPPAAKRQWVGLTDEEIEKLREIFATRYAIEAIEAKLKEKNTP